MKINNIGTVLFDLDGTLVNPSKRLYQLFVELTGCGLSYDEYWELKDQGLNQSKMLQYIHFENCSIEEFSRQWIMNVEREDLLKIDFLFNEVKSILSILKRIDIRLFVVTNRQSYDGLCDELEYLGIFEAFEAIVSTFQKCSKADAVRMANIDINDAIFVGDSREDMQAAKDLGIRGVLVERKSDKDVNIEADYYIRDLNDLRGILF